MHYLLNRKWGICSALSGIVYLSSDGYLNRDCSSQSSRLKERQTRKMTNHESYCWKVFWCKLPAAVGQEDCKLQVSYIYVIYVLKRQNKAILKHVQQTAQRMCKYEYWYSKWPFAQPASFVCKNENWKKAGPV